MRKLVLGIDADGTCFNLVGPWLEIWNGLPYREDLGLPLVEYHQVIEYNMHKVMGPGGEPLDDKHAAVMYGILEQPDLFHKEVKLCQVAASYMRKWHDEGHEVRIVSAPAGPNSAAGKLRAFARDFPWLNRKHIDLIHHKHRLELDVLIDDSPDVVRKFESKGTLLLGVEQPWNERWCDLWSCLAPSYREPERAWAEFDRHIQDRARS